MVHETPTTAVLNGNYTLGHVAATRAMQLAIAKAKKTAVAAVGVHNLNHIGRVGTYPLMAAEAGWAPLSPPPQGGPARL